MLIANCTVPLNFSTQYLYGVPSHLDPIHLGSRHCCCSVTSAHVCWNLFRHHSRCCLFSTSEHAVVWYVWIPCFVLQPLTAAVELSPLATMQRSRLLALSAWSITWLALACTISYICIATHITQSPWPHCGSIKSGQWSTALESLLIHAASARYTCLEIVFNDDEVRYIFVFFAGRWQSG